jgi:hypothetical protein
MLNKLTSLWRKQTMPAEATSSTLLDYVKQNMGFQRGYEAYQPDLETVARIASAAPNARMVVVAENWCGDSRRLVPAMARIVEQLPGWQVEVHTWNDVRAIPTFIVYRGERELGRIVERTRHGLLEDDLLHIVTIA